MKGKLFFHKCIWEAGKCLSARKDLFIAKVLEGRKQKLSTDGASLPGYAEIDK
jgi:hypothetical protein